MTRSRDTQAGRVMMKFIGRPLDSCKAAPKTDEADTYHYETDDLRPHHHSEEVSVGQIAASELEKRQAWEAALSHGISGHHYHYRSHNRATLAAK